MGKTFCNYIVANTQGFLTITFRESFNCIQDFNQSIQIGKAIFIAGRNMFRTGYFNFFSLAYETYIDDRAVTDMM